MDSRLQIFAALTPPKKQEIKRKDKTQQDTNTIHGLEVIAFHRTGFGVNLVLTDSEGRPVGWQG